MKTSPIDSVLIDLILTHFNILSFQGKPPILTGDKFDELVKEAEQEYYKKILREEPRGNS